MHDSLWNVSNILAKYGREHRVGDDAFNDVLLKADLFVAQMRPFAKSRNRRRSICRAPLLGECPQHHGHKGDPGVTPETCGTIGERAQVILVWVRAPGR